jgi:hypothetical protein
MTSELVAEIQRTDGTWAEIRRTLSSNVSVDASTWTLVLSPRTKLGAPAVRWTCNCEGERGGVCRHLRALWSGQVTEDPAQAGMYHTVYYTADPASPEPGKRKRRYLVRLTELGSELLRERWAALALAR